MPDKFHSRGAAFEPPLDHHGVQASLIKITIDDNILDRSPEHYTLEIGRNGLLSVTAASHLGVLHGLNTMTQIFYGHSQNRAAYTPYAPVRIEDWPRFQHRGLNLDISRNEITPDDVVRTLDAMSYSKMNRLHLHMTDSQSWPLDIPTMPELASRGAYREERQWNVDALRIVQAHGYARGVEVYLEIDMPGHTSSIYHSYPDFVIAYGQPLADYSASEPPSGQLALNDTRVLEFVGRLLTDVLARSSIYSSNFHLGGDELNTKVYELDPAINSSSKDVIQPLLQKFYDHALQSLRRFPIDPIFWEETVLDWDIDLPQNAIIQVWRSAEAMKAVTEKGYRAIFGSASHWYLDCGFGTFLDAGSLDAQTVRKPPYLDWCSPQKNWRQVYSYDPLIGIPSDQAGLVIGGEVHLWTELTDGISLDSKLWPRAAAAAEILWRGPSRLDESVTRRLAEMRERLVKLGVRASVVQMQWCLQNPGHCVQ